jgi:hypothetical protein
MTGAPLTSEPDEFDPMLDCYLSWEAYIAHCRERLETTGEYPPAGPWRKSERQEGAS